MADPTIKDLAYRGLASVLGGPVDLAAMVMRPFGYNVPEQQVVGGSEWIGKQLEDVGLVSSARAPVQEFITSMAIPTPSGLAKGAALGGAALVGSIKMAGGVGDIANNLKSRGIANTISENAETITVSKIMVPESIRNKGFGTKAMNEIIDYANQANKRIVLTPSEDFGGTKSRLIKFYKKLGFVENKGKNKDFSTMEAMYKDPS